MLLSVKSKEIFGIRLPWIDPASRVWSDLNTDYESLAAVARRYELGYGHKAAALIVHRYNHPDVAMERWRESFKGYSKGEAFLVLTWFGKATPANFRELDRALGIHK